MRVAAEKALFSDALIEITAERLDALRASAGCHNRIRAHPADALGPSQLGHGLAGHLRGEGMDEGQVIGHCAA